MLDSMRSGWTTHSRQSSQLNHSSWLLPATFVHSALHHSSTWMGQRSSSMVKRSCSRRAWIAQFKRPCLCWTTLETGCGPHQRRWVSRHHHQAQASCKSLTCFKVQLTTPSTNLLLWLPPLAPLQAPLRSTRTFSGHSIATHFAGLATSHPLLISHSESFATLCWSRYIEFELAHFIRRWEAVFRGHPRIMKDTEINQDQLRRFNLILFGTPESNAHVATVFNQTGRMALPIGWSEGTVRVGSKSYDAGASSIGSPALGLTW